MIRVGNFRGARETGHFRFDGERENSSIHLEAADNVH